MEMKDRFLKHLNEQKSLLKEYEKIIDEYSKSDIRKENETLKKKLNELESALDSIRKEQKSLTEENRDIKTALKEQIIDEKTKILKLSKSGIITYFQKTADSGNRLLNLENSLNEKIGNLKILIDNKLFSSRKEALNEIEELSVKIKKQIKEQSDEIDREKLTLKEKLDSSYTELQKEDVDPETIEKRKKQNRLELKIGLNVFNKLGIFLILIAIGVAAKYSYTTWFNDYAKGILFYSVGIIMLGLGEIFFRKNNDVFSKGLIGGGIAALYSATFFSYFALNIINMNMGLLISILITVIAIVLSLRYNSKIIATFALIGGYIPFITFIFAFDLDGAAVYAGMGYLFLLNLSLLLLSFRKNWKITNYTSFFLNLPCLIYLVLICDSPIISITYSVLIFIMYLGITLVYPLRYKIKLRVADIILLAINTITGCAIIYLLFELNDLENFRGLLALIFALIYIGLGYLINRIMKQERETIVLFYGTALSFVILMIPFQFGIDWLSMGWLVEGVILSILGFRYKIRYMEYAGWGLFGISLGSFYLFDLLQTFETTPFREFKYTMVILAMIIVLINYLTAVKKEIIPSYSDKNRGIQIYKIITIISFYIYSNYMVNIYYFRFAALPDIKPVLSGDLKLFYYGILTALIHITLALILPRVKLLAGKSIKYISIVFNLISIVICLGLTIGTPVLNRIPIENSPVNYISIALLAAFNIISLIRVREMAITIIDMKKVTLEIYPIVLSTYLLGVLISLIIFQFDLGGINLIISFLFLLFAIGNIIFGFVKKYSYIRLYGLGLSLFSTGKLFLWDLRNLNSGGKIIAYFGFGLVLILISFIYQKIKKEIDRKYVQNQ